jgi:UDP-GlcNAc:undecaprenyl-phosphate/decaprenyl-phosphate GlcNAc-1-phosphate transferase
MTFLLAILNDELLKGFRAPLVAGLVAMLVTWLLTPAVRKLAIAQGAIDDPKSDDRRVHKEPIPRWGGVAIYAGIFISLAATLPFAYPIGTIPTYLIGLMFAGAAIVVVGALDDLHQYKAKIQALFILAIGVAIQFVFSDAGRVQIQGINLPWGDRPWIAFGWAAIPITAIYLFVVTKTMDTIDGIDGLAAGIAAIAAATLSVIATYFVLHAPEERAAALGRAYKEFPRIALIAAAIAGAALGFLRHNYNPAKIFMGTGGAQLLGFLLAAISIVGVLKSAAAVAIIIPMLAFGVPILDAVIVVIRRIMSGSPITQADKRHLHHTLLGKGLTQRQAVWVLYSVAILLCVLAILAVTRHV